MDRDYILDQMKITAAENGGVPLGRLRFESALGIKEHHWTKFWARYSDLVTEAGLAPNTLNGATPEEVLLSALAELTRALGRFPTDRDLRARRAYDERFPNHKVFSNSIGTKAQRIEKLVAYCRANPGYDDVLEICEAVVVPPVTPRATAPKPASENGFVYLLKSGRFYKIGKAAHAGARERQLQIQLPEAAAHVHVIRTDDPAGIEAYWHQRFAAKRKNGEWFDLDREDVSAFRRRKFM